MNKDTLISTELTFGAHNYNSLPVVLTKAKGVHAYDTNGKKYIDMMSAYSAVSLGHSNCDILKTLTKQVKKLGVVSRAFHNDKLPLFLQKICTLSNMDKCLPMNTGAEAVETALKIARKWGEKVKGVAKNKGQIIACENNFHGRTLGAVSLSTDPQYRDGFGPFLPGIKHIAFNDLDALKKAITKDTVAFIVEPIQGEAGIIVPDQNYLSKVRQICHENNVLMIADEIQTGLARTGAFFCHLHDGIEPDLIIVGKALGGGIYPVSAVLANKQVMNVITPGDHGSTFGGNTIASAIALKSLDLLSDPKLINHVKKLGEKSISYLKENLKHCPIVKEVRGKGLFIGIEFTQGFKSKTVVLELLDKGLLTKDTHESVMRIAPPLIIKERQMFKALDLIVEQILSHVS